jgi:hypothetical protein
MKPTKILISLLMSLLVAVAFGSGIASATGLNPWAVTGSLVTISFIPMPSTSGVLMATVYKEVWTGEVVKALSRLMEATFLDGISDYSRYVSAVGDEAQAIHLVYMGVEPDVLINNTTYPIPLQELGEEDIVITLDKYQTKVTPVTDDELYALSYDKMGAVKDAHANAIAKAKYRKAIHSLAPSGNTAAMPVLVTSGADDGTGRKRLVWDDIVRLKREADNLEHPDAGRRLVLCADHVNDLLMVDQKFKDQYYNATTGKPFNMLGFDFYSYLGNPYYNPATKAKLAFGAVPAATDRRASVYFALERASKANGWTKMYFSQASTDPEYQRNKVNFRHHYIVLPKREDGRGAIVSGNV